MVKFEHEIILHNDVDEIFSYLANPECNPIWDPNTFESMHCSDGEVGVGTTGKSVSRFLGRSYETNFTCDDYDPPHLVSHRMTAGPMEMETTNGLKDVENGTHITLSLKVKFKGLNKLKEPFVSKRMKKQFRDNLEALQLFFRFKALSRS
jgi:hypothetical protein